MRHRKAGTTLNRTASHRKALMRNMVTSLFEHERIVTTDTKAKMLRSLADKMITMAKRDDLHSRRQALSIITKKSVTHKLFSDIKDRYLEVSGGYTSLVKIGPRKGDAADMTVIELVKPGDKEKAKKKARKKAAPKKEKSVKADAKTRPVKEEVPAPTVAAEPDAEAGKSDKESSQE